MGNVSELLGKVNLSKRWAGCNPAMDYYMYIPPRGSSNATTCSHDLLNTHITTNLMLGTFPKHNVIFKVNIGFVMHTIPCFKEDLVSPLFTSLGSKDNLTFFCPGFEPSSSKTEHCTSDPMLKNLPSSGKLVCKENHARNFCL